jgi:hypothetical protein
MADYFHSALRGNQIHESRIKVLPTGTPFPVPEWEGQFLAIGKNLYYSILQNNALTWFQPVAFNSPTLPANVVIFESGLQNPPLPRSGGGRVYANSQTQDIWYLSGGQWLKLGASKTFDIISGRSIEDWRGNYFGLLNPSDPAQDNCLLIKKWQPSTKYYLVMQTPTMLSLGGSDDNLYYFELWKNSQKTILSTHVQSQESTATIDTASPAFTSAVVSDAFRLGLYIRRNSTKLYLNFTFNLDTRLIAVRGIANVSSGY